jgi:hypothetical protein
MAQKTTLPHSWPISVWPADVYPNDRKKARYLVRSHKDELLREGALVRVGRELVIIGAPYSKWLQKKAAFVPDYVCPANAAREVRQ